MAAMILKKREDVRTEPLDVGGGEFKLVDVIAQPEHAPMTGGVAEIWAGPAVEFEYDDDGAICYMLDGEIDLTEGGTSTRFEPGDVVYIPQQAGLKVDWSTPSYGRFFYVTYPHWR